MDESIVGLASMKGKKLDYSDVDRIQDLLRQVSGEVCRANAIPDLPLGGIVKPGSSVLLKPNWVLHQNFSGKGTDCLVTHPNFVLAVLREVFSCSPKKVVIGDAPVQGCIFENIVTDSWRKEVEKIATCPYEIVDFRRTVLKEGGLTVGQVKDARSQDRFLLFDLKEDSLLEPVSKNNVAFRITCYDPDILAKRHHKGKHQYLLCKEPFESDVIINLPKVKTHKKAGLTAALKNLVGINGNKEYLPHHRVGSLVEGGDCYRQLSPLKRIAEYCLDEANRNIGTQTCARWMKGFEKVIKLRSRFGDTEIEGGWYGNDTVWRMALDLNRIALYGRLDGTMSDAKQRHIYSIADGIIGGQGEGPLAPTPLDLGVCTLAASSAYADLVHSYLLGLDFRKIPLVREAFGDFRFPLVGGDAATCQVAAQQRLYSPMDVSAEFGQRAVPARGWQGHIEL
ncbi:DUF362 domain-containing protein [Geomonas sp. Red69]|uniref:DUF362 domain-containing protein n=1 Tax=Geomonas diazotrophica TaxID=2843197 RepID=A0ABX8JGU9_9BACT|nr:MULTISPECIES: DUF362 domain-containing protein [Geomonas]MBU5635998.1 DUF362 domain-containing protein [Geomonas diazotrophica]QWV96824.1 DUF362 domain-containing protein [Geomonas nitrogeniifigens]QXE85924.1 DUF362 domain-containing protein [Geomonas nitrogeniifigens]